MFSHSTQIILYNISWNYEVHRITEIEIIYRTLEESKKLGNTYEQTAALHVGFGCIPASGSPSCVHIGVAQPPTNSCH